MKKTVIFVLATLFAMSSWAQTNVMVKNSTKDLVVINGVNLPAQSIKELSLLVENNTASFEVVYYEGLTKKGPVRLTRMVNKGRMVLNNFEPTTTSTDSGYKPPKNGSSNSSSETSTSPIPAANNYSNASDWWGEVNVQPQNKLKGQSIFVPSDPFKGLALKPGQISAKTARLRTGTIVFPVFLSANDSTKSGSRFAWALVNKIVTEGQTVFEFLPEDIMKANAGDIVRKTIISRLPSPFIISDGKARGIVVTPGSPQRLELYVGWNIVPIQYQDSNGFPTEAILVLLVDSRSKALMAKAKNKAGEISVVPSDVVITTLGR
jgi:hypothetical protein